MTANLVEILKPECVRVPLVSATRQGAIEELVDLLAANCGIPDPAALKRSVWERELQRSTGIGEGLAIPHGKCPGLGRLCVAIGRAQPPIDFDSIDRKPVQLLVLLVSPPERITDHIQVLGRLSRLMSDPFFRQRIYGAPDAASLWEYFRAAESTPAT